jgi:hypothetical protein
MVKSGEDRAKKYSAKFDAEVVRSRYAATSEIAKSAQVTRQQDLYNLAAAVRDCLNGHGIYPVLTAGYLSFANKLYGLSKKFLGSTLYNSAQLEYEKWVQMLGLPASPILDEIWGLIPELSGSTPSPF